MGNDVDSQARKMFEKERDRLPRRSNGHIYIYTLLDPDTLETKYVGQTEKIRARYKAHFDSGNPADKYWQNRVPREQWIRSLRLQGKAPRIIILDEVPFESANEAESTYFKVMLEEGHPLLNAARATQAITKHSA